MMEMLDYVKATPKKIKENINNKNDLVVPLVNLFLKQKFVSVIIIASGSSMNAAEMAKPYVTNLLNCPVTVMTPELFELTTSIDFSNNFIFFISQSGASTNILHALQYLKNLGHQTIALTGNVHSEVAQNVDTVIDYGVGIETVGYVTVGMSSLVLYLALFANEVAKRAGRKCDSDEDFIELTDIMTKTIADSLDFVNEHLIELAEMQRTFICGNNMNLGVAREAALKFQETLKIPTMHYEVEEFMHGPDIQLSPVYTVFLIDNPQPSKRILDIFKGLSAVISRRYLVTYDNKIRDHNIFNVKKPVIEELCSLVAVPFFQVIVANMMPTLNCEKANPLADKFMNLIPTKDYTVDKG